MNLHPRVEKLVSKLEDASMLVWAAQALHLDTMTNTPKPARGDRALVTAKVEKLAEKDMRNPEIIGMLNELVSDDALMNELGSTDPEQAALLRALHRTFRQMHTIPEELRMRLIGLKNTAEPVWEAAKETSNFSLFLPCLKEMFHLQRQMADYLGHKGNPYDAMLGIFDPGMTAEKLKEIFGRIKPGLIRLAQRIADKALEKPWLIGNGPSYDQDGQMKLSEKVMEFLLFDYDKGGPLSLITHPRCTNVGKGDTRITTRFLPHNPFSGLLSTAHETGHAGFSQGVDETLERIAVDGLDSLSGNESQSRLYENLVCRGREFWTFFRPTVQQIFPQLKDVSLDEFYLAVNWVEPSLIRIEADEVTYNLHVIIRFEIEEALINGSLKPEEAPGEWNSLYQKYLGLLPPDDGRGILQDVHWSHGYVGYFPTYSIGTICSVLIYQRALQEIPEIPSQIAAGNFRPLREWLREKIHRFGYLHSVDELLQAIGTEMNPDVYLEYLSKKYSGIYGAL